MSERKSSKRQSMKRQSVKRGSMKRQSMKRRQSSKRQSMKGGADSRRLSWKKSRASSQPDRDIVSNKWGEDEFFFENGDRYVGEWIAIFPDVFARDGRGVYYCSDGSTYFGKWNKDHFVSGTVTYPCGQKYVGDFKDGKYNGSGAYVYPRRGEMMANFVNNVPLGEISFMDQAGLKYVGRIQDGEETISMMPINIHMSDYSHDELFPPIVSEPEDAQAQEDKGGNTGAKKSTKRKSVSRKSVSRKSVSRKSVSRKSLSRKSLKGGGGSGKRMSLKKK